MFFMPTNNCDQIIWKHPTKRQRKNLIYITKFLLQVMPVYGKVGNPFLHKIEQPQKDIKNTNAIEAIQHFNNTFHKHGKFIQIEQMNIIKNTSTEILKQRLKDR